MIPLQLDIDMIPLQLHFDVIPFQSYNSIHENAMSTAT